MEHQTIHPPLPTNQNPLQQTHMNEKVRRHHQRTMIENQFQQFQICNRDQ